MTRLLPLLLLLLLAGCLKFRAPKVTPPLLQPGSLPGLVGPDTPAGRALNPPGMDRTTNPERFTPPPVADARKELEEARAENIRVGQRLAAAEESLKMSEADEARAWRAWWETLAWVSAGGCLFLAVATFVAGFVWKVIRDPLWFVAGAALVLCVAAGVSAVLLPWIGIVSVSLALLLVVTVLVLNLDKALDLVTTIRRSLDTAAGPPTATAGLPAIPALAKALSNNMDRWQKKWIRLDRLRRK